MTAEENRSIIEKVFHGLARSDASAFLAAMADDFVWVIEGQSRLSGRYEGKAAVETELLPPLFANFAGDFRTTADEIIVAGDRVVVLAHGEVTTVRRELYEESKGPGPRRDTALGKDSLRSHLPPKHSLI